MANVLPPHAQKEVWILYRSRIVLMTGCTLLVLAAAALLSLIPSYVALYIAAPPVVESGVVAEEKADAIEVERAQLLMQELSPILSATSSAVAALEAILAAKPTNIRIMRITYQSHEEGQIMLGGSGTREAVSTYKEALTKSGAFSSVSVPVGALVSSAEGGFTIVLTGDF